ncbi:MAG: hypothetical protein NTV01_02180 [Bacteroidia bacterium]|nr:hypothetical protein [Bacteroidia bacterium]
MIFLTNIAINPATPLLKVRGLIDLIACFPMVKKWIPGYFYQGMSILNIPIVLKKGIN